MTAIERLEEALDEKDARITMLEEELRTLKDESERTWLWARHFKIEDDKTLPVPRLEIRCRNLDDWYNWEWHYGLVYRHMLGDCIFVPLGHTTCNGGGHPPLDSQGNPNLPFRDGVHIRKDARQLNLPAYCLLEGQSTVIDTTEYQPPLRSRKGF